MKLQARLLEIFSFGLTVQTEGHTCGKKKKKKKNNSQFRLLPRGAPSPFPPLARRLALPHLHPLAPS